MNHPSTPRFGDHPFRSGSLGFERDFRYHKCPSGMTFIVKARTPRLAAFPLR